MGLNAPIPSRHILDPPLESHNVYNYKIYIDKKRKKKEWDKIQKNDYVIRLINRIVFNFHDINLSGSMPIMLE